MVGSAVSALTVTLNAQVVRRARVLACIVVDLSLLAVIHTVDQTIVNIYSALRKCLPPKKEDCEHYREQAKEQGSFHIRFSWETPTILVLEAYRTDSWERVKFSDFVTKTECEQAHTRHAV